MTILEIEKVLNRTLNDIMKTALKTEMEKCRTLTVLTETRCVSIEEGFVTAASKDGEEFEIKADTIIFAAGMKARTDEANTFFGIAQDTNIIGDANRVGTVWNAMEDGYYISAAMWICFLNIFFGAERFPQINAKVRLMKREKESPYKMYFRKG